MTSLSSPQKNVPRFPPSAANAVLHPLPENSPYKVTFSANRQAAPPNRQKIKGKSVQKPIVTPAIFDNPQSIQDEQAQEAARIAAEQERKQRMQPRPYSDEIPSHYKDGSLVTMDNRIGYIRDIAFALCSTRWNSPTDNFANSRSMSKSVIPTMTSTTAKHPPSKKTWSSAPG